MVEDCNKIITNETSTLVEPLPNKFRMVIEGKLESPQGIDSSSIESHRLYLFSDLSMNMKKMIRSSISSDDTKYSALVANLDAETLSYVSDIVLSPPNSDKYHTLSQRLITQFSDSETQKIKKLLTDLQLGDEKPSHLLRKMKELSNGQLQDDFLQSLWLQRMPPHIQTVLSASSESLDKLAIIADKVSEVVGASSTICAAKTVPPPSQSSSCSAQPTMDSLARQIQELSLQVAELTRERNSSRHQRYSSDRRRSYSRSRSVNRGSGICYYHRRYKEQARKCVSLCAFVQKNE
ncbi:uncharacterized protein TNCV_3843591 [Trichonephila clavipes]|nr:uncharacterized protein TNCV_3843591 [Trichonephila clavipes]